MQEAGAIIDNKYEVIEPLGRGGMGEVLLVRHLHLDQLRVVKILRQDHAADETSRKRFSREARLATQIKHPNVAILYDFARLEGGSFYMVWEYIEGKHVGEWLQEKGPFPLMTALELAIQALRGLEAIHANGVVHRDISPDNLMITRDRRDRDLVKIIDLGLAKNLLDDGAHEVTQVGMFMGKLRYCSPEQAEPGEGQVLDRRSDLYSFGLILYEMICGLPPAEAESPHAAVMKRLSEPPLPISTRNPQVELPAELDAIMAKALEREPEGRFADAVEFIEALERLGYALRQADTRKIELPEQARTKPPRPVGTRATEESSQLTKEERMELLARINRAADRKQEMRRFLARAEKLVEAEQFEEAREVVGKIEAAYPQAPGLEELKGRLEQEAAQAETRHRQEELEEMIEGYIQRGQLALAELALETLVDLYPTHRKRQDYESWVEILRQEVEQDRLAQEALLAGREALEAGDYKKAKKKLAELERNDRTGDLAGEFAAELEATRREEKQSAELEEQRKRFEEKLAAGEVDRAAEALDRLASLGLPRVTLDLCRKRLDEARQDLERSVRQEKYEADFAERIEAKDWYGAREAALALEKAIPFSSRPAEMFTEINRLEEAHRREQAVEQGTSQVESLIEEGELEQAQMALDILLRMAPEHDKRREFEERIAALREA